MSAELKMGGEYRHYKTGGRYRVLQLVRFESRSSYPTDVQVAEVTFAGDGPLRDRKVTLSLSFVPSVRLYLQDDFGVQGETLQVLYWSDEKKLYFARPLSEFVAQVAVDGVTNPRFAPRFELMP